MWLSINTEKVISWSFSTSSLSYLQDELVDERSSDATEDGTNPVDPVIVPGAEDDGRSKGPGWVHAGAGFYVECRFCTKTMRS